jgi:hypothetical protein
MSLPAVAGTEVENFATRKLIMENGSDFGSVALSASQRLQARLPSETLGQKMAQRPLTTFVISLLAGALVAEGVALMLAKAKTRRHDSQHMRRREKPIFQLH